MQTDEGLGNSLGAVLVHGKSLARPIERTTHSPQCVCEVLMVFFFPFHGPLKELLTTKVVSRLVFPSLEHLLYNGLCSDTCVVATRQVQSSVASHPMPPDENIL